MTQQQNHQQISSRLSNDLLKMIARNICRGQIRLLLIGTFGILMLYALSQAAYLIIKNVNHTDQEQPLIQGLRRRDESQSDSTEYLVQNLVGQKPTPPQALSIKLTTVTDDGYHGDKTSSVNLKAQTNVETLPIKKISPSILTTQFSPIKTQCKIIPLGCFLRKSGIKTVSSFLVTNRSVCSVTCWTKNLRLFSITKEACSCADDPRKLVNISSWTPCIKCVDTCDSIKLFKTEICSRIEQTYFQSFYIGCLSRYPIDDHKPKAKKYKANTIQSCIDKCESGGKPLALKVTQSEGCWCAEPRSAFSNASRLQDELLQCSQSKKVQKVLLHWTNIEDNFCSKRRFKIFGNSSSTAALMSLPGSGNTWLRYMLEVASGIYTGSFYHDSKLLRDGFLGEILDARSGRTLLVKDHFHPFQKMENYDKMVLLLRNPFHAILAEFQRIRAGHTGIIDNIPLKGEMTTHELDHTGIEERYFQSYSNLTTADSSNAGNISDFLKFVEIKAPLWNKQIKDALDKNRGNSILIKYEDLLQDFIPEIQKILAFLGYDPHKSIFQQRLICLVLNHEGSFKRVQNQPKMILFNHSMRNIMKELTSNISEIIYHHGMSPLPTSYYSP